MERKLKFTLSQKILEGCTVLVLLFLAGYLIVYWPAIPDTIPSHYNAAGVADAWSGKGSILFVPVVCVVLYSLITIVSFFPSIWNVPVAVTEENKARVYTLMRNMVCVIKLILVLVFTYITVCTAQSAALSPFFLPVMLLVLFGSMIYYIVRIVKSAK